MIKIKLSQKWQGLETPRSSDLITENGIPAAYNTCFRAREAILKNHEMVLGELLRHPILMSKKRDEALLFWGTDALKAFLEAELVHKVPITPELKLRFLAWENLHNTSTSSRCESAACHEELIPDNTEDMAVAVMEFHTLEKVYIVRRDDCEHGDQVVRGVSEGISKYREFWESFSRKKPIGQSRKSCASLSRNSRCCLLRDW